MTKRSEGRNPANTSEAAAAMLPARDHQSSGFFFVSPARLSGRCRGALEVSISVNVSGVAESIPEYLI